MTTMAKRKRKKEKGVTEAWLAARFPLPPDQFHWRAGPYHAPAVKVGTVLHDECRGDIEVEGFTEAPISWPAADYRRGRGVDRGLLPILCGDLVRAVCEEDELTVAHYWGVTRYMVEQWKRALSGAKDSDGIFAGLALKRGNPEFRRKFGYK
jgi:hypothetical protein